MARSSSSSAAIPGASTSVVPGRSVALNLLISVRPGQWTKNLLVFAGVLFGRRLLDPVAVADALGAFAVFCGLSSAVYLINDIADRESDRRHPLKARRPMAILLYLHAAFLLLRGVYVLFAPPTTVFAVDGLLALLFAEPTVLILALSLLGVALVREHAEQELRQAATTDDLTGALNRRSRSALAMALPISTTPTIARRNSTR